MFDVVGKHSIAAKANRYTTIKGLTARGAIRG